jgi:OFA family oxalate/formate antiporter-like MFS transporter
VASIEWQETKKEMPIKQLGTRSQKIYYGWIIVAVGLVSMAFWTGIRSSFSIFYVALLEEFPWSRGESAGVQSLSLISYTILAPLVGGLIDRFGPRRVIVPGILILSSGLILCGSIETLTQFYIFYGVVAGAGITCIAIVSYSAILAHWFEEKRGLASGIAVSGMGLGTFLMVPLSQHSITLWGFRFSFVLLGILVLIVLLPLNGLFLRHKPQELGLYPDGLNASVPTLERGHPPSNLPRRGGTENSIDMETDDWTLRTAIKTRRFWALVLFPFFAYIGLFIIQVHNVKFLVDQGFDKMTAAYIFAMIGVVSLIFRIFWGWLSDHIWREITYSLGLICLCLGIGSLLLMELTGQKALSYPFFIFFGMGWGVTAPLFISIAADLFKGKGFGLIYGIVEGGIGVAGAIGAWSAGFIFDRTHSYQWAFLLGIIVVLISGLLSWVAAPRKVRMPG